MLELLVSSLITILPDYLFRRFGQGKRLGREITIFSIWYELRWGITACVFLTISLITVIFFYHPSTSAAVTLYRSIPILPEASGRVNKVFVDLRGEVKAGDPIFSLDSSQQQATVRVAQARVAEAEAAIVVARSNLAVSEGQIEEAQSALKQARDELETRQAIRARNTDTISAREVEKAETLVQGRQGTLNVATANRDTIQTQIEVQLPAEKQSAEAALAQAEADLAKTVIYAGVDGRVEQFSLRVGDVVNPFMRPAGVLIPANAGTTTMQAGFNQIEAGVIYPGMIGEAACNSRPFEIISLVVTDVQNVIAAGQFRASDQLVDLATQKLAPGTLTVYLEPLFKDELDKLTPGSSCTATVYTNNYKRLESEELSSLQRIGLHAVDTVGMVKALILRIQTVLMPVQTLVFSTEH
ncbi:MAG: secretion protein HlyD [Cereibacter sphaeroides]|uniref:Secretion protein HlyD n=1 Tax=Cereibacter sphaeroides TaxID=1063 RepID=A0A2W5S9R4_CERSP|nr:MAG: secretion protein HlyD [Cereibacter sphaeroides]